MPRDLDLEERPISLTESPNSTEEPEEQHVNGRFIIVRNQKGDESNQSNSSLKIHPYTRPLTISDLDSCVALENAAFPIERERCSREKFTYRLTKCPELSLGIFCTATPNSNITAETLKTGKPVESGRQNGAIAVLLAHIVATMSLDMVVSDNAMNYPQDWDSERPSTATTGHQEDGRTICVHSLGVLPEFQGRGLGRILMTAYIQQMSGAGIADRIAIIAHEHLVGYYEKLGFTSRGPSKAQFGGGGWIDLVYVLKTLEPRIRYG